MPARGKGVSMRSILTRSSDKFYRERPSSRHKAARMAWDHLAKRGDIDSLRLLDGLWMCKRPDGTLDDVEAVVIRDMVRAQQGRG